MKILYLRQNFIWLNILLEKNSDLQKIENSIENTKMFDAKRKNLT